VSKWLPKGSLVLVIATSNKAVQGLLAKFLSEMQGLQGRAPFKAKVALAGVEDQLPDAAIGDWNGSEAPHLSARDVFVHKPVQAALMRLDGMRRRMERLGFRDEVQKALVELVDRLSTGSVTLETLLAPVRRGLKNNERWRLPPLIDMATQKLQSVNYRESAKIEMEMLMSADVLFCTLSTLGRPTMVERLKQRRVSCAIVDEASQSVEGEMMLVLPFCPQRVLLVGDQQQLSATVVSKGGMKRGWDRSLMRRLFDISNDWPMLLEQHRMAPEIACFPSRRFYQDRLENAPIVLMSTPVDLDAAENMTQWRLQGKPLFERLPRYVFVDVRGAESHEDAAVGMANKREANLAVSLARRILQVGGQASVAEKRSISICLLTFYRRQATEMLDRAKSLLPKWCKSGQVQVHTVDSYQGCEADVVILSGVRTNKIGFLQDYRRVNVAITRAKRRFFFLGCAEGLHKAAAEVNKARHMKKLIDDVRDRDLVLSEDVLRSTLTTS